MFFQIILAILGISLLIVVHESGHYLVARAAGMRVTRFSIGFGPALIRYQPPGSPTLFQICIIPLLAYVVIAGMNPAEEVDPADPELYPNKGLFARIATIFAGPLANYLAASLMIFGLALISWPDEIPSKPMTVSNLAPGMPAARAGLKVGDVIRKANRETIRDVDDLIRVTKPRAGKATEYVIERQGETKTFIVTPVLQENRGIIGVTPRTERHYRQMGVGEAASAAIMLPYRLTELNLRMIFDLARRRSTEGISGPLGIGKIMVQNAEKGAAAFIDILIQISIALGMFNLLPLPALDGGRLAFLGFELITRRRPNERVEAVIHTVGLLFFLALLVLVTLRDAAG
jgi:regulator of sigma E protease